jgi:hypothetical protein
MLSHDSEGAKMKHSESIIKISKALVQAQAEMPPAKIDQTNSFLGNRYATLGSVIDTAKPVLEKYGLAVTQFPLSIEGSIGVETILIHESGEWMAETIFIQALPEKGKSAAQVAGSIVSYLRRYAFAAVLGMYADEDNDGNDPNQKKKVAMKQAEDPRKKAVAAIKRSWTAHAKKVGLMENVKDAKEMAEFQKVMSVHIENLSDTKVKLEDTKVAGIAAMDKWAEEVAG